MRHDFSSLAFLLIVVVATADVVADGFLKDREATVREAAACALADAGPHGELLLIEGVLKDSNSMIRSSAALRVHVVLVMCFCLHDCHSHFVILLGMV